MVNTNNVLRRFLLMALVVVLVFSLIPTFSLTAYAANVSGTLTGLADTGIGAAWTATTDNVSYASWSVQSGTEILGTAVCEQGQCSDTDHNTTLSITNNKIETAVLSFTYTITGSGTIQMDGTTVTTGSTFSKDLAAGESVKIYLASNGAKASATITMSNITLLVNKDVTTTFTPAENGSYTVGDKTITETYSNTQNSLTAYSVNATPNDGYKFVGWYSVTDESYLSTNASDSLNFDADKTITAVFTASDNLVFSVGTKMFFDLDEATSYAVSNSIEKVTLVQNGKSITGTHTIPSGVTLLIPFDSAATLYKEVPVSTSGGSTSSKNNAYRTLTLAEGAVLNVEGGLSVGGTYRAAAGSSSGYMTGNYGMLNLSESSSINVKYGGSLYAWGYVVGTGTVTAESGGTVWEWFQIGDFRGGTATMGMGNKVFPFSQYFIQNIEAPLTIQAGAKENVYTGVYASSKVNNASIEFIGNGGMFKLNSGSITRIYDASSDHVIYTVSGDMELNSLSLNLAGANVNSASYVLPITNNISINVASGKAAINQDLSMLAGVQLTIANGANVTVASGKSVYVYDADEWNAASYTCKGKFVSAPFAYSRTKTRSEADLVDAKIDVNGTLTAAGYVYTTAGGANICSSEGTGQYIQQAAPGTETETYQYTQSGSSVTKATITITAAKLRNADDSYVETSAAAAGDTYSYKTDKWIKDGGATEVTVTFDANGGTGTMDAQTFTSGEAVALTTNAFTREGYKFTGWNTAADGSGASYVDGAIIDLQEDITLYAQWQFWNGWQTDNLGTTYYADGEIAYQSAWATIDAKTYYFNERGYIVKGLYKTTSQDESREATFVFDTSTGEFLSTQSGLFDVGSDTYWTKDGEMVEEAGLQRIITENGEINYYYFATAKNVEENPNLVISKAVKNLLPDGGTDCWIHKTNGLPLPEWGYWFDANGVILHNSDTTRNGVYEDESGIKCYYVDGVKAPAGLVKIGDDYYYAKSNGAVVVDGTYYCSRTNGLMDEGTYAFDADGKMLIGATSKNGIVAENNSLYYYVNGTLTYAGLIEIDGDYYYVRSNGEVVHNQTYYITWTHGRKPQASYVFDESGKLLREARNGIVAEDGSLFYYRDDVRTYVGLIQIDGDYYYVRGNCEVVHSCTYTITWTHDLLPQASYTFDESGKIILDNTNA